LRPVASPGVLTPERPLLIIGVVRDVRISLGDEAPRPFVYVPWQQQRRLSITILARGARGQRVGSEIRALLASMNPDWSSIATRTLDESIASSLIPYRAAASVSGGLGIVGVLLAAIGIYGVTAYTVTRRTREIGIRIAMGARRRDIVSMVLRQGMVLTIIGAVIGLVLAALAVFVVRSLAFGVPQLDVATVGGTVLLLTAVSTAASYVPAHRATRIDPLVALRCE
jgi:putative ABC transport system permease protein